MNNFVHNVVFDILQQIFHGRIDRKLDRQLAISVFLDGRLIERILAGQTANDAQTCVPPQVVSSRIVLTIFFAAAGSGSATWDT